MPEGTVGEMYVGGGGDGRGYLRREELTAERFIDRPVCERGAAIQEWRFGAGGRRRRVGVRGASRSAGEGEGIPHRVGRDRAAAGRVEGVRAAVVIAREEEPGQKRLVAVCTWSSENEGEEREQER